MRNPAGQPPPRSSKTTATPCCSKVGIKRGPWTAEEDEILAGYIKREGEGQWRTLPERAGLLRCGKSCRLRWMNYLRPHLKRGHISPDEEDLILRLHRLLGNRWSLIAGRIPGRTDNEIKNYWNTHLAKKLINQGLDPRNHKPLINYSNNPPNPNFRSTAPAESALHHPPPNPNPISASNLPSPVIIHQEGSTSYNNNNRVVMAGCYSSSSQGTESSREGGKGEIGCNCSEEMLSFLDTLIMNEDALFQQPHQTADHGDQKQLPMAMQPTAYGSGYQGFDYRSSVWESGFCNER